MAAVVWSRRTSIAWGFRWDGVYIETRLHMYQPTPNVGILGGSSRLVIRVALQGCKHLNCVTSLLLENASVNDWAATRIHDLPATRSPGHCQTRAILTVELVHLNVSRNHEGRSTATQDPKSGNILYCGRPPVSSGNMTSISRGPHIDVLASSLSSVAAQHASQASGHGYTQALEHLSTLGVGRSSHMR